MQLIDILGQKLQPDVLLADYTTFKIGGPARYFFVADNEEEIVKAVTAAVNLQIPFYFLGNGSNLLVSDQGFNGLVIKLNNTQIKINGAEVVCGAGVLLQNLIKETVQHNLLGLESFTGIPGTVGGAVYGNAGAYGKAIGDFVEQVAVLILHNKKINYKNLDVKDCGFGYRTSVFKNGKYIILETMFKLRPGDKKEVKTLIKEIAARRKNSLPWEPSAGCCFKNVEYDPSKHENLNEFVQNNKIIAGKLIDSAGLKGVTIGGAQISSKHANFIINCGQAKAVDVLSLIKLIKQTVQEKFHINLEEEIRFLGFEKEDF